MLQWGLVCGHYWEGRAAESTPPTPPCPRCREDGKDADERQPTDGHVPVFAVAPVAWPRRPRDAGEPPGGAGLRPQRVGGSVEDQRRCRLHVSPPRRRRLELGGVWADDHLRLVPGQREAAFGRSDDGVARPNILKPPVGSPRNRPAAGLRLPRLIDPLAPRPHAGRCERQQQRRSRNEVEQQAARHGYALMGMKSSMSHRPVTGSLANHSRGA